MTITIVVPAYNAQLFVGQAIRSCLPVVRDIGGEVIVVDDGSVDDTEQVARAAGCRVIRHRENRGIASALNTGIAAAATPWVSWLSADDWYTEMAARHMGQALQTYSAAEFVFGSFGEVDLKGQRVVAGTPRWGLPGAPTGFIEVDYFVDLLVGCFVNGSTVMMKRNRLLEAGLFSECCRYSNDYAMWLQFAHARIPTVFIAEELVIRRNHAKQTGRRSGVARTVRQEVRALVKSYAKRPSLHGRIEERLLSNGYGEDEKMLEARLVGRFLSVGAHAQAWRIIKNSPHPSDVMRILTRYARSALRSASPLYPQQG